MAREINPFGGQRSVRGPWRQYVDGLTQYRAGLYAYCRRLTGNIWDAEDLVQDTLMRVFSLLGKTDAGLENPKSYLIRTATNLWIDRVRRSAREQAVLALEQVDMDTAAPRDVSDSPDAVRTVLQILHPQERAAILLKEVFDLSLEETASTLNTTVGAVKSALSRARGRLDHRKPAAAFDTPPRALVEAFMQALRDKDMEKMRALCAPNIAGELVGGVELASFEQAKTFFEHAHMVMPRLGFGTNPWWKLVEYEGETMVVGFRTLDGVEGVNEVHRFEAVDGKIVRARIYCFCPETLAAFAEAIGANALPRPHRSPSIGDFAKSLLGLPQPWRRRAPNKRD